ncbi:hypothetical protein [Microbacterium sp. CPCC 204701]|nr:hypothetical protein [Microbacterium sp. CPCC 204701]
MTLRDTVESPAFPGLPGTAGLPRVPTDAYSPVDGENGLGGSG